MSPERIALAALEYAEPFVPNERLTAALAWLAGYHAAIDGSSVPADGQACPHMMDPTSRRN